MQRGHDGKRDGDGDAVHGRFGQARRQEGKCGLNDGDERRLANPAEPKAGHRDAELRGGDVAVGVADRPRAAMAFGDQLVHTRLADRDDREFRRHEESVGEDECQNCGEAPPHHAFRFEKKCASTKLSMMV